MRSRVSVILVCLGILLAFTPLSDAQWARAWKLKDIPVTALAVTGTHIFAGTTRGVFRSSDDGANWTAVNSGLPKKIKVTCLAVSGTNLFLGALGHGVFLSTNNGASWRAVNSGLADRKVMWLLADGEKIFAATMRGGVFLSTDNGNSWMTVSSGLPKATSINCLLKSGHRLFAGTSYRGFFLSTDDGANWTEIKSIIYARNPVSCMAVSGEDLIAGTVEGVFRSTDGGVSWKSASSPLESLLLGILPQTSVMCLAVSGPYIFAGTDGAGVYVSSNRDKSWSMISSGLRYTQVHALAVKGENLFAGTSGGVWRFPLSDVSLAINLSDLFLSEPDWETIRKKEPKAVFIPKEIKAVMQEGLATRQGREDIPFTIFRYLLFPAKDRPHEVVLFSPSGSVLAQLPDKAPPKNSLHAVIFFRAKNADLGYTVKAPASAPQQRQLAPAPPASVHQANLNVFIEFRQTDEAGASKVVREVYVPAAFEEDSATYDPDKENWYSVGYTLRPGKYTIVMAITPRTVPSTKKSAMNDLKKVGVGYFDMDLPEPESYQTALETTPVFFVKKVEHMKKPDMVTDVHKGMFTWSKTQLVPNIDNVVSPDKWLRIAYYVLGAKPKRWATYDIESVYEVQEEDGRVAIRGIAHHYHFTGIDQLLPLKQTAMIKEDKGERQEQKDLAPGKYYLVIKVKDKVSDATVEKKAPFEVK